MLFLNNSFLRCISYTVKFTLWKCIISELCLIHCLVCSLILETSSYPKTGDIQYSLAVIPYLLPPAPSPVMNYFLSLWICLLLTFIYYVSFCDWFLSFGVMLKRFLQHVWIFHFFSRLDNTPQCGYTMFVYALISWWTLGCFLSFSYDE